FLEALEILEVYGTAYTQLALAVERIVAIVDSKYERRMAQIWKKILFIIALASTLYLPILVNELICEVIKITAFQCLFFSSFLFHQHRRIMSKSADLRIFASPQATENYFSSYAAAWK
ncbi:hypothetical protein PENTCL1PPCAC_7248, partial [Pristionchus entomophagus]